MGEETVFFNIFGNSVFTHFTQSCDQVSSRCVKRALQLSFKHFCLLSVNSVSMVGHGQCYSAGLW